LAGNLAQAQKEEIVSEITRIHCEATGDLPRFVQIQFEEVKPGDVFKTNFLVPLNLSKASIALEKRRPRDLIFCDWSSRCCFSKWWEDGSSKWTTIGSFHET
jgi:phenylpyruvate tautomerase PptA (4-oxalocrotonate tautomerase family)